MTPIDAAVAFQAIYRVLFDRDSGPKAGSVLAFLEPEFVRRRFRELPVSTEDFWRAASEPMDRIEDWLRGERAGLRQAEAILRMLPGAGGAPESPRIAALEIVATGQDGRQKLRRALLDPDGPAALRTRAEAWIQQLSTELNLPIPIHERTASLGMPAPDPVAR